MNGIRATAAAAMTLLCGAAIFVAPAKVYAQSGYCDSVARDYARRNSSGGAISGAIGSGIRGGITGRIINGDRGAKKGRRIGGTIGAVRGIGRRAASYDYLYGEAYRRCMNR